MSTAGLLALRSISSISLPT